MDGRAIWDHFPEVERAVAHTHQEFGPLGHHDLHHDRRVGNLAFRLAMVEWADTPTGLMAGLAGLCHSADRLLTHGRLLDDSKPITKEKIRGQVKTWLSPIRDLGEVRLEIVMDAVLKHDQPNGEDDSRVLIALMDADRLVNLSLDAIMRAGQHRAALPSVDYKHWLSNPHATYLEPLCVRTTKAQKIAKKRARLRQQFLIELDHQLGEEGYLPYQFEE